MTPKLDEDNTKLYFLAKEAADKVATLPRAEAERFVDFLRLFISFNDFERSTGCVRPQAQTDQYEQLTSALAIVLTFPQTDVVESARAFVNVELGSGLSGVKQ